jgi:hypothetical protein
MMFASRTTSAIVKPVAVSYRVRWRAVYNSNRGPERSPGKHRHWRASSGRARCLLGFAQDGPPLLLGERGKFLHEPAMIERFDDLKRSAASVETHSPLLIGARRLEGHPKCKGRMMPVVLVIDDRRIARYLKKIGEPAQLPPGQLSG